LQHVIGTPYYLSPEVIENRPYSLPTDIWSLGVLLYELCAMKKPFIATSFGTLALKIVKGVYPDPPDIYSYGVRGLLKKMLSIDPISRPVIQKVLRLREMPSNVKEQLSQEQAL
jgi:NIMA (never in mitosis gene a)-related kinase